MFDDGVTDMKCLGWGGMQSERVVERGLMKREEVVKALHRIKCDKAVGMDGIAVEFLKLGDDCVVDWLVRIFNICMDWQNAFIVPFY